MPVRWAHLRSCNNDPVFSLEEVFRLYGSWSGIHSFNFEDEFALESLELSGGGSSTWHMTDAVTDLPPNFTVSYHKEQLRQGVQIAAGSITYLLVTDSSGYPSLYVNGSIAQTLPVATPAEADVQVVFRQQLLDENAQLVQHSITLYMNERWYFTYSNVSTLLEILDQITLSFGAYDSDTPTYDQIRIPELCETAEFGTLDPGENAAGGLQRTIDGRYLKFFVRYDGTMRAWRKKERENVLTLGDSTMEFVRTIDLPMLVTHARMRGAYVEGVYHDPDLISKYMHRFAELDNAMLFTERECDVEAQNTVRRSEEAAFGASCNLYWIPVLEPEDRVTADGEEWVIDGYTIQGGPGKQAASYRLRKYVWGSS